MTRRSRNKACCPASEIRRYGTSPIRYCTAWQGERRLQRFFATQDTMAVENRNHGQNRHATPLKPPPKPDRRFTTACRLKQGRERHQKIPHRTIRRACFFSDLLCIPAAISFGVFFSSIRLSVQRFRSDFGYRSNRDTGYTSASAYDPGISPIQCFQKGNRPANAPDREEQLLPILAFATRII